MFKRKLINCPGGLNTAFATNSIGNITTLEENVGININNPSSLLHVNGDLKSEITTTSNIQSTNCTAINILSSNSLIASATIGSFIGSNITGSNLSFTNLSSSFGSLSNLISSNISVENLSVKYISSGSCSFGNLISDDISSSNNIFGIGIVPVGTIMVWPSYSIPNGYLLCDGSSYERGDYNSLFLKIGTSFGNVDSDHFNVPDFTNRVPVGFGQGTGLTNRTIAQTGGLNTVTLNESNLPSHNHTGTTSVNGEHNHIWILTSESFFGFFFTDIYVKNNNTSTVDGGTTDVEPAHSHTLTTNNQGGGQAHNNMQPYINLNFIIKY